MKQRRGFSLIELLAVIGIMAVLAAILFPVFLSAREEARKAACIVGFRQSATGQGMYLADHDDRFVPAIYNATNQSSQNGNRRWPQVMVPYVRDWAVMDCPSDPTKLSSFGPSPDPIVPALSLEQYEFAKAERVNHGYNYLYLSPIYRMGTSAAWTTMPRSATEIENPSDTFMYMDSVFDTKDDRPVGGGSFLVVPPCRFEEENGRSVDSYKLESMQTYLANRGWTADGSFFGGAWAWHGDKTTTVYVDGHVKVKSISDIQRGCTAVLPDKYVIVDPSGYDWDIE